jgi:succinate dehydrogenase / fumarate reductase cytochrome b subunit
MEDLQSIPQDQARPRKLLRSWFDVRHRRVGSWAFALNRLTGLGLTLYLFLHFGILTILLQGESAWNDFVVIVKSPLFLFFDVILLFGLIFHGLNGIRVALVGTGISTDNQRSLFWVLMAIGLILLAAAALLVFTV